MASAVLAYGGYWALAIRRASFSGVYRSQALWIGFFSLYFIPFVSGLDQGAQAFNSPYSNIVVTLYYIFLSLLFFRLVDVDVSVARRSDPLLRDTLHWRRLRLSVWAVMGAAVIFLVSLTLAGDFLPGFSEPRQVLAVAQALVYLPFLVTGVPGLLLAASRSRDSSFRRSLKWLGLFFVILLITSSVYFATFSGLLVVPLEAFNATGGVVFIPGAYCLYRSAKSLAPLTRLPLSVVDQT